MPLDLTVFLNDARAIVGPARVLSEEPDMAAYQCDWRGRYRGHALAVLLPGDVQEVSALVKLCGRHGVAIVPQGGNTGLTGGAVASAAVPSVLVNLSRLNRVRELDVLNNSMTVEAGCILAHVREQAQAHDRLFPMLLGSVGSCEVGGLVSSNAGGTAVLRYGNMRELVMGLEVVLADGRIWNGLRALRKDNTGYDLKQCFIGAEGTLGLVTAAVLKLFPLPSVAATAMVALDSVAQAVDLLRDLQQRVGNRIEAFEIVSRRQVEIVLQHGHGITAPMPLEHPFYVLVEISDSDVSWDPATALTDALEHAMDRGLVADAVVATDGEKARRLWEIRHNISEANKRAGFTVSNDTSVPVSRLPAFIEKVTARLDAEYPEAAVCHVGHIGDGNIHVIVLLPRERYASPEACEQAASRVNFIVHEESVQQGGSISAEHGIGQMHVERLAHFGDPLELELMRAIKAALDPRGLLNPGKIFRPQDRA